MVVPDRGSRRKILEQMLGRLSQGNPINFDTLTERTEGMTSQEIEEACRRFEQYIANRENQQVEAAPLEYVFARFCFELKPKYLTRAVYEENRDDSLRALGSIQEQLDAISDRLTALEDRQTESQMDMKRQLDSVRTSISLLSTKNERFYNELSDRVGQFDERSIVPQIESALQKIVAKILPKQDEMLSQKLDDLMTSLPKSVVREYVSTLSSWSSLLHPSPSDIERGHVVSIGRLPILVYVRNFVSPTGKRHFGLPCVAAADSGASVLISLSSTKADEFEGVTLRKIVEENHVQLLVSIGYYGQIADIENVIITPLTSGAKASQRITELLAKMRLRVGTLDWPAEHMFDNVEAVDILFSEELDEDRVSLLMRAIVESVATLVG